MQFKYFFVSYAQASLPLLRMGKELEKMQKDVEHLMKEMIEIKGSAFFLNLIKFKVILSYIFDSYAGQGSR